MSPLRAIPFTFLGLLCPLAPGLVPASHQDPAALSRGLEAIKVASIKADLDYLASPERGGRSTPSAGLDEALAHVVQRLEASGWMPGGSDGWYSPFPLFALGVDDERSGAQVTAGGTTLELAFGQQILPERMGQLRAWDLDGPLVSVGAGEEADIAAAELQGAWALIQEGPASVRGAVLRAREAGAIGMLVTPGTDCRWREYNQRFASVAESMVRGLVTQSPARGGRQNDPAVVMITEKATKQLLSLTTVEWSGKDEGGLPPSGVQLGVQFHDKRILVKPETQSSNVIAWMPGTDPDLGREVVLLTAHVDHLGEIGDEVRPGANDNASGVAALLAVADALAARGPGRRGLALLFLVGMEKGSWGAKAWLADPALPEGRQGVALINLDRVGRLENDLLFATPSPTHPNYSPLAAAIAGPAAEEALLLASMDDQWSRLDTRVFATAGLPVLSLSSGADEDTHLASDTRDKVHAGSVKKIARTTLRLLERLDGELLGLPRGPSVADGDGPGPPDADRAMDFGLDLIAAADSGEVEFFLNALDREALVQRALSQSGLPASRAERAWLEQAAEVEHLWRRVVELCTDDGQYSILNVNRLPAKDDQPERCELLMRLARETDFDYHRLLLDRDGTQAIRVIDMHALSRDEWASATLARHHALLSRHPDSLADLRAGRSPRCLAPLGGLHVHYDEPDLVRGMSLLEGLSEDLSMERDYLRMAMLYTWGQRRTEWAVARGRFEAAFPEARGAVVWAVCDTHGWDPEPSELAESLDALVALTNDFAYPTFLRGMHSIFAEQPALARPFFAQAMALEPDFQESWWCLLNALKDLKDWPALAQHLDDFGAYFEFEFTPEEMLKDTSLTEFVQSSAFTEWQERYRARHTGDK
ncbi:MAG: M28 family metallopeptidase [Planctomycetota bacterium]|nr:M28 family metallopeptidase [Planctomycetota bacterium]